MGGRLAAATMVVLLHGDVRAIAPAVRDKDVERARKLDGTVRVTSRPGHGTRVLLVLPLTRRSQ
jgi:hypothetical protein